MKSREKGTHTWDIFLRYHRCPQCGVIQENRQDYMDWFGKAVKQLECPSCGHRYTETRRQRPQTETLD
jgi:uncharacterized C2H2 Zn-finger protein